MIIYSYIKELLKQEEYRKAIKIELNKLDNNDTNTKSKNNSSKEDSGDNF